MDAPLSLIAIHDMWARCQDDRVPHMKLQLLHTHLLTHRWSHINPSLSLGFWLCFSWQGYKRIHTHMRTVSVIARVSTGLPPLSHPLSASPHCFLCRSLCWFVSLSALPPFISLPISSPSFPSSCFLHLYYFLIASWTISQPLSSQPLSSKLHSVFVQLLGRMLGLGHPDLNQSSLAG